MSEPDPDATQDFEPFKDDDDQEPFRCQPSFAAPVVMIEPTPMREIRRPDQS